MQITTTVTRPAIGKPGSPFSLQASMSTAGVLEEIHANISVTPSGEGFDISVIRLNGTVTQGIDLTVLPDVLSSEIYAFLGRLKVSPWLEQQTLTIKTKEA